MIRGLTLILTVLTGFSGLVYEVTWQKGLAILLGSHSEATAAVLAIFLGGLSLGYGAFGRVSNRITERHGLQMADRRLLLVYGGVEAAIGLWALVWPVLFDGARALSGALPIQSEVARFSLDLLLTALLIGPPTVLMGGTIPLLTQALARGLADATRFHAFVYGFNTLGAFAGALAGGFFLVPWLGIPGTLTAMGLVNLSAGASFLGLSVWTGMRALPSDSSSAAGDSTPAFNDTAATVGDASPLPADGSPEPPSIDSAGSAPPAHSISFAPFAVVALLLGFAMMAIQTVLIRIGGLSLGASHFSFAMLVATFVLCIALGSLLVSLWERIPAWVVAGCPLALGSILLLLYPWIDRAPYAAHVLRSLFRSIDQAFYPYHLTVSLGILTVLAVPIGLSGASLPLLFHALRNVPGDLGGVAGRLYGWNTVGNLLGALLGGYLLLFWLDLHHVYRIAVAAIFIGGGILLVGLLGVSRHVTAGAVGLLGIGLVLTPPWDARQLSAGYFRAHQVQPKTFAGPSALLAASGPLQLLFHDDDPTTTVTVLEGGRGGRNSRSILTNGKSDGSLLLDYPTMALAGLLPCLLASQCQKAFVIGLGTGVTAGELGDLESMEKVRVTEISPGVIAAAPLFENGNRGVLENPKIEIVRSDAYRALLHSEERWDVISSEPSNPWVVGVEMLFSREFLEAARDRLSDGGVYAQWMHTYETNDATLELVLRTYASVFDRVAVWYALGSDLLLLGFRDAEATPKLARIAERLVHPDFRAGLARSHIESLETLLAHELVPVGLVSRENLPGEVHTLLHPFLSHQAARAFFVGGDASLPYLPPPPDREPLGLLDTLDRQRRAEDPEGGLWEDDESVERIVRAVCESMARRCATLIAYWLHVSPESSRLERILATHRERPKLREHLSHRRLEVLASFFEDGPGRVLPGEIVQVVDLYFDYYHHALPFHPDALRATLRSCVSAECARLGREVEHRLNGFSGTAGR